MKTSELVTANKQLPNEELLTENYPINHYGIIGDLHSVALISPDAGIEWCCLPVFDCPSVFAAILDKNIGGHFSIGLDVGQSNSQRYLHNTNILQTELWYQQQHIEILDYMPILTEDGSKNDIDSSMICRHIECVKGLDVKVKIDFKPKPDYAKQDADISFSRYGAKLHNAPISLYCSHSISWDETSQQGYITLNSGDIARVVLCYGDIKKPRDMEAWTDSLLLKTQRFWEKWISKCNYKGRWRGMVERSALALKLLTFNPTGAILAAATTSLPEEIGGERNWDYRFSWLRDSALIINALFLLGFTSEARHYQQWLVSKCPHESEILPILYSITDIDRTYEVELDHLEGYKQSKPVRIGNAAHDQLQLDVYGEVIDSVYLYSIYGGPILEDTWGYVVDLVERICNEWQQVDEGIWEVRGDKKHFTYSKLMCWVGLDRAIRMANDFGFEQDVRQWEEIRTEIRDYILEHCVHKTGQYFTQSADTEDLDASNLLIPIMSFLPPTHELVLNTLDATLQKITQNKMVYRYLNDDGLKGHEGTFNICTFWMIEALSMAGRTEDAIDLFNNMLHFSGPLGLYAEETDAESGVALGNYPQAFTHVGLINAALTLNQVIN